jgi:hypothetical protein
VIVRKLILEGRLTARWAVEMTAIAPPSEWPVTVTLVAPYLEIPVFTAVRTAVADLD